MSGSQALHLILTFYDLVMMKWRKWKKPDATLSLVHNLPL